MKGNYQHIIETIEGHVGIVTLHRPEVHNAMNIQMIREITSAVRKLEAQKTIRVIRIDATGKNFCAGADLNWMKEGMRQDKSQLLSESKELALLFNSIFNCDKVTMVVARGRVMGGANGLLAAADIGIASEDMVMAFSEVKLGLIPATIAPYIKRKAGESIAIEWMITGREINAMEAYNRGMVNVLFHSVEFDKEVENFTKKILANGPEAIKGVKDLFRSGTLSMHPDELLEETSQLIARFRTSSEGQEGIAAFFEKRKPAWKHDN